jgi:hypothetical protein
MYESILAAARTVIDHPLVSFSREVCGHLQAGLRREWLVTNGEILEGDVSHLPRGCVAQAWGVAEVLRVWRQLEQIEETA